MRQPVRRLLLGLALLTTLIASVYPVEEETNVVAATPASSMSPDASTLVPARANEVPVTTGLTFPHRTEPEFGEIRDPFRDAKQQVATVVNVAPEPPAKPVAPPLPFTFKGRLDDDSGVTVILANGNDPHLVRAGDVFQRDYRVDEIGDSSIKFTYLPLNERQELKIEVSP